MWEQWNDTLHESEQNQDTILKCDTNDKIKQIYTIGLGQLMQTDFGLMAQPLKHHQARTTAPHTQTLAGINCSSHPQETTTQTWHNDSGTATYGDMGGEKSYTAATSTHLPMMCT